MTRFKLIFFLLLLYTGSISQAQVDTVDSEGWESFDTPSPADESSGLFMEKSSAANDSEIFWLAGVVVFTVLAGFAMRLKNARSLRGLFLAAGILFLGFYRGGCPCPISGLQNVQLNLMGESKSWLGAAWFLALIPVVYLFGRVWCGWVCHLGAFQEILYRPGRFKFLTSRKSQKILKVIRISLLVVLVAQVFITRSNLFKEIDPFKAAFNLYAANVVTWALLALLIISSVFVYRPFCRAVCPAGVVFSWIGHIRNAFRLRFSKDCNYCRRCAKICGTNAIAFDRDEISLRQEDCLACGRCIEECSKEAIRPSGILQP